MQLTYENQEKTRLDKYLTEQYPNTSRSQIQKTIKNGGVLVNGEKL
ncbi:MAG: S4 domain-containing protein [bacterium]